MSKSLEKIVYLETSIEQIRNSRMPEASKKIWIDYFTILLNKEKEASNG